MTNLASSGSTQVVRDEDYARMLQTEELSPGINPYISLTQRFNRYKMDNFFRNNQNVNSRREDNEDSVIIIDDDIEEEPRNNNQNSEESNKRELEEMIRSDELLARRIQADFDREIDENSNLNRQINRRSRIRPLGNTRVPHHRQVLNQHENVQHDLTSSSNNQEHSNTLQNALRYLHNNNNTNNLRNRTDNFYNLMHPSIEQDMFNLMARNISSNELSTNMNQNSRRSSRNSLNQINHGVNFNHLLHNTNITDNRDSRIRERRIFLSGNQNLLDLNNNTTSNETDPDSYERLLRLDERNVKLRVSRQEFESLTKFQFKTIKNQVSESDKTCSICFDDYESKSICISLVCSHKFHSSCIKKWLNQSRKCPLCQKDAINGT